MLTILIPAVILFALLYRKALGQDEESKKFWFKVFVFAVCMIPGLLLSFVVSASLPARDVPQEPLTLIALQKGDPELYGRIFIAGYIETHKYYEYEYLDADGVTGHEDRVQRYNEDIVINKIYDQPEGNSYLVKYDKEFAQPWFWLFALEVNNNGPVIYDFHLPWNAVIPNE